SSHVYTNQTLLFAITSTPATSNLKSMDQNVIYFTGGFEQIIRHDRYEEYNVRLNIDPSYLGIPKWILSWKIEADNGDQECMVFIPSISPGMKLSFLNNGFCFLVLDKNPSTECVLLQMRVFFKHGALGKGQPCQIK